MSHLAVGKAGEDLACRYLGRNKYKIIARNYLIKGIGELDVVVKDKSGTLVFVEVKTMSPGELKPEDQYSSAKRTKMVRACEVFLAKYPELVNEQTGWRMDLMAIELPSAELPGEVQMRHYQNL
ncbi:MAG TPA: YraN family protein [Candidatus Paceibacterota bacterium]